MNVFAEFVGGMTGTDPILYDGTPQIAFIGRSNVGKSSVINALVNRKDLVKVSATPGRTAQINCFKTNTGVYLVDLPGYGYAKVGGAEREKLKKMILWYLIDSQVKPLVVLILDVKAGCTEFDEQTLEVLREQKHAYLIVANKVDKLNQKELSEQLRAIRQISHEAEIIECSTLTNGGIRALSERLFG